MIDQPQTGLSLQRQRAARTNRARATRGAASFTCARCGCENANARDAGSKDILASLARDTGFRIYRCRSCHAGHFEEVMRLDNTQ